MPSSTITPRADATSYPPHSNHHRRANSSTTSIETETICDAYQDNNSFRSSGISITEKMPSFTGDKKGKINVDEKSLISGIGGWFSGTSTPPATVRIPGDENLKSVDGITTIENTSPRNSIKRVPSSNMPTPDKLTKPTPAQSNTPSPSRFAFFGRSSTTPIVAKIPSHLEDEFTDLDITNALFPNGPADPFSPSSFKNLLMNAEALLRKLQTAYKVRTLAVHELTREKEAQADELEEAETRAAHFKSQLEDLGKKLMQQDHDILSISNELASEKQLRAEEKVANEKMLQNLKALPETPTERNHSLTTERSLVSRGSRSSFESYNLEDSDSVFSHSRSHISTSSAGTGITTPEIVGLDNVSSENKLNLCIAKSSRNSSLSQKSSGTTKTSPTTAQPKSVFSKLIGGAVSSDPSSLEAEEGLGLSEMGCANCRGGDSSVAWDAVGLLRAENKGLKDRVGFLEDGVDDVLNIVYGGSWR